MHNIKSHNTCSKYENNKNRDVKVLERRSLVQKHVCGVLCTCNEWTTHLPLNFLVITAKKGNRVSYKIKRHQKDTITYTITCTVVTQGDTHQISLGWELVMQYTTSSASSQLWNSRVSWGCSDNGVLESFPRDTQQRSSRTRWIVWPVWTGAWLPHHLESLRGRCLECPKLLSPPKLFGFLKANCNCSLI